MTKKAIILLSGGQDSLTTLAIAKNRGFEIYALSFCYGQRHNIEISAAKKIAKNYQLKEHKIANIDLRIFGGSALTDKISVPKSSKINLDLGKRNQNIPITYVPARNTIFLSYSLAYAEAIGVSDIFIGVNAVDYSGYPDCRPEFIESFEDLANLATASAVSGRQNFKIHTPLIKLTKKEIVQKGLELGVDYSLSHSCYDPVIQGNKVFSCGKCDACQFRLRGFREAGIVDPVQYIS